MGTDYVGIMIGKSLYRGIRSAKTGHEALPFYEEAGKTYDMIPCYFRLQDIDMCGGTVCAYMKTGKGYARKMIPVPHVIHNRTLVKNAGSSRTIRYLLKQNKKIFNLQTRCGKWHIHQLLRSDERLRPHLPDTAIPTADMLGFFLQTYDAVILKPNSGSVGKGIVKIEKIGRGWLVKYRGKNGRWKHLYFEKQLPKVIKKICSSNAYIVQQFIPLATYRGRPFDLRVSVQKDQSGAWQVTGMNGKVAAKNSFLTNVAQGGFVLPLQTLIQAQPHLSYEQVRENVEELALNIARHLDRHLPLLADLGLDIGLAQDGFPVFIECNGRDQRYSFLLADMVKEWKATYYNPIGYARYLLDQMRLLNT